MSGLHCQECTGHLKHTFKTTENSTIEACNASLLEISTVEKFIPPKNLMRPTSNWDTAYVHGNHCHSDSSD